MRVSSRSWDAMKRSSAACVNVAMASRIVASFQMFLGYAGTRVLSAFFSLLVSSASMVSSAWPSSSVSISKAFASEGPVAPNDSEAVALVEINPISVCSRLNTGLILLLLRGCCGYFNQKPSGTPSTNIAESGDEDLADSSLARVTGQCQPLVVSLDDIGAAPRVLAAGPIGDACLCGIRQRTAFSVLSRVPPP